MVVRLDQNLDSEIRNSSLWSEQDDAMFDFIEEVEVNGQVRKILNSLSGHERNHLFMNRPGNTFEDVSLYSGVDSIADSRANVFWDFDHDGYLDIALINGNDPYVELFHNQLKPYTSHQFVAVRLVGGNDSDRADPSWSNRDGIGATVMIQTDAHTYVREQRAGEGFAAQNSKVMLVGIGTASRGKLKIRWPSGIERDYGEVTAGAMVTCYEDLNATFDRTGREVDEYPAGGFQSVAKSFEQSEEFRPVTVSDSDALVHVYVSMATWCAACKAAQPQLQRLADRFGDRVRFWGIPVDPLDSPEKLQEYEKKYRSVYKLEYAVAPEMVERMKEIVTRRSGLGALPSTLATTSDGKVIDAIGGVPTVSQLARWLEQAEAERNATVSQSGVAERQDP